MYIWENTAMGLSVYLTPHEQFNSNQFFKETLPFVSWNFLNCTLLCKIYKEQDSQIIIMKEILKIFCKFQVIVVSGSQ